MLTNSRLKCYRRCPREHHLAYELGYRAIVEAEAARFGTLVHRALEAWWRAPGERLAAALAVLDHALADGGDPFDVAKARALMTGYHARWIDEPYEVLEVEVEFAAPLTNPETGAASKTWCLGGKLDVVVRDQRDGRVLIIDHKTASEGISVGSSYWKRLRLDSQISAYCVGGRALGYEVAGFVYDVIAKPGLRPLKATPPESRKYTKAGVLYAGQRERDETPEEYGARVYADIFASPEEYFARGEVPRLEQDLRDHAFDAWQLGRQIREAELAERWPRNPDACVRYGRTCDFFAVCSGEASLEDPARYRRLEHVHAELAPPDASAA
ncbi:MAG TPA: PD-(D/E)XK nuclease family protein [Planctomycetota bacterium]|nr:PD-(D/E)XK nuclease family protein [Planctomycetota bacterium]